MTPSELEAEVRSRWNFDDPEASFEVMTAAANAASEPDRSIWMTQTGRALGLQERFTEADEILDHIDADQSDHVRARVAIERGRVHNSRGDPEKARLWFALALREAEAAGTEGLAIDAIHMMAIVAPSADEALQLNEMGLARAEASHDPDARRWRGSLLNNLGWTHFDAGRAEEALVLFEQALAIREEEGDPKSIEFAHEAVAEARQALGQNET